MLGHLRPRPTQRSSTTPIIYGLSSSSMNSISSSWLHALNFDCIFLLIFVPRLQ